METFWANRSVLVTGGASFIGSHLVEELVANKTKVTVIDNFTSGKEKNLIEVKDKILLIKGDCRSYEQMLEATNNIDVIFHLAAAHGGRGYIDTHPVECSNNMVLDGTVFKACNKNKVDRICFASSGCVYPTNLQIKPKEGKYIYLNEDMVDPFENGKCAPDREYGWAKLSAEMTLKAYHSQYKQKGVSCRFMVAYGERENETHAVIALIAKALIKQDPFEIWGDGKQDRSFIYVKDVAKGLMRSAEKITDCSAVNIGTDIHTQINELAEIIFKTVNFKPKNFDYLKSKPVGVYSRAVNIQKMQKLLDWKPEIGIEEGIQRTVDWYKKTKDLVYVKNNLYNLLHER